MEALSEEQVLQLETKESLNETCCKIAMRWFKLGIIEKE